MTTIAEQLEKLAELHSKGLISREEFDSQKDLMMESSGEMLAATRARSNPPEQLDGITAGAFATARKNIGAYKIIELIAEGGMGAVYRGRHRSEQMARRHGGDVAVKVMHRNLALKENFRDRFEREAGLSMALEHPGLVRVYDLVVDGGMLALVMEFVRGEPLSKIINEKTGPIPHSEALPLFRQIAEAVGYMHENQIIHRDLKPENAMLGADGTIKLIDFGIAKEVGSSGGTKTGTGMGTVDYMAPEQFTDASSVDHRADIYALGMTLYHMLAGRLPWAIEGRDVGDFTVMTMKAKGELRPVTEHYPDVPAYIVSALQRSLDPAMDARPQSVAEFLAILKPGKTDTPTPAVKTPSRPPVAPVKPQVDPGPSPASAVSREPTPPPTVVSRPTVPQANTAPKGLLLRVLLGLGLLVVLWGTFNVLSGGGGEDSKPNVTRSSGSDQSVGMSPAAGLRAYYAALDRRDQQTAYRFFRRSGWDNDRWKRKLWRTAGCARVNDSYVLNQAPWSATVGVDLCVEDTARNVVDRWQGSLPMAKQPDGRWALSGLKGVRKAGQCDSSCRPR